MQTEFLWSLYCRDTRLINESRNLTADLSMRLTAATPWSIHAETFQFFFRFSPLCLHHVQPCLFLSSQTAEEAERGQSHQAARGSLWCPGEAGWRVSHVVAVLVKKTGDTEDQHSHTLITVNSCVSTFLSVFKWDLSVWVNQLLFPLSLLHTFSVTRSFSLFVQLLLSGAININIASSYPVSQRTSCSERLIEAVAVCVIHLSFSTTCSTW